MELNNDDDIQKKYADFKTSLNTLLNSIDERLAILDKKEKAKKKADEIVQATLANASEIIKLNVGGKHFETHKSTLTAIEGTYFHALLSSGRWKPSTDGKRNTFCIVKYRDILY
ncbi:hypothetical protein HMI54_009380 [Coelomomyces lativittatus]|nr:hypothetical protein HMI54_009380 [Coelomomyces lativittatus]